MIVGLFLLKLQDNVTDRQTDGQTRPYLLPRLAETTCGKKLQTSLMQLK